MTIQLMDSSDDTLWEVTLQRWMQSFSPLTLGMRLAVLLHDLVPDAELPLLEAIVQQYEKPEEKRRWQLFEQAKIVGFSTPTGALALSQFWSAGSMSPEGLPPVYPEPQLSPQMLHCASIMLITQLAENPCDGVRQLIARNAMLEGS